ncbi:hypothetical protein SEA_MOOSEHEAD_62 [Gordonia phage Moosehead]|nr:hypothetical protein SEA_MOOSEHEAD_62 [Gordonia phage Moosehead]
MGRRGYTLRWRCAEDGCTEQYYTAVDYKADYHAAYRRQSEKPWRCLRHNGNGGVLSPENTLIRTEVPMTVKSYGKFWDRRGLVTGPGFKAYADDFPDGTTLIVTVEAILPKDGGVS